MPGHIRIPPVLPHATSGGWLRHAAVLLLITAWSFFLLNGLFIPRLSIVTTPEFEISDAVSLSYASKVWYARAIRTGHLPVWSDAIGTGFPVLGEGQTGVWYTPNLVLYSVLPTPLAYNLSLVATLAMSGWGMYAWMVIIGAAFVPAVFGALTVAGSGYLMFHLQHMALLQGFALTPALMAVGELVMVAAGKRHRWAAVLYACITCQQLFSGFAQAAFISHLAVWMLLLVRYRFSRRLIGPYLTLAGSTLLGAGLAAIQLVPSVEFLKSISVSGGFSLEKSTYFSFPAKHLLTFLDPFILGNPKSGTYFPGNAMPGGIFWECIGYVGIVPVGAAIAALFVPSVRRRLAGLYIGLAVTGLLMLGRFSPIYLVYAVFPFTLFRVPARFVIPFALVLTAISVHAIQSFWASGRKGLRLGILGLCTVNLLLQWRIWQGYHQVSTPRDIARPPELVRLLPAQTRLYQIRPTAQQRETFYTRGWTDPTPYDFMRNGLMPDANLIWGISTYDAYPSRSLKRHIFYDSLFNLNVVGDEPDVTLTPVDEKLLDLASTDTVLSGMPASSDTLTMMRTLSGPDGLHLYLYRNPTALPRAYVACNAYAASTLKQARNILADPQFIPGLSIMLEGNTVSQSSPSGSPVLACGRSAVAETSRADGEATYRVEYEATVSGYLVVNQTFYPGWEARLDGKPVPVYAANVRFQAVPMPPGTHTVTLRYAPGSLVIGMAVTAASAAVALIVLVPNVFPRPANRRRQRH
jgi:hypothetical protein